MADIVSLKELQRYIPGLTAFRFEAARRHILQHGRGTPVPQNRTFRVRIDDTQLDHFLHFITSPHVVQDLPFGQRYLKLSNGQILETPNVIRSVIPSRICNQYRQYCKETEVKPLSTSTMKRILDVCAATTRKSLQGLDYISADGAKAFDDLSEVISKIENMSRSSDWAHQSKMSLKEAKQYIKTDYKVHVLESSSIPDHCIHHSLSDGKDEAFLANCDHRHDYICSSCEKLTSVLKEIETAVSESSEHLTVDQHDDIRYTVEQAVTAINSWKSHQLRSVQQDKSRTDLLENVEVDEVLITQDWAMKFLPQKYRETQEDWFGKRGISWHISVALCKTSSGKIIQQTFVHIIDKCSQDSSAVVTIMEHTLRKIKEENPEIKTAFYRQDNAGCYHSAEMVFAAHLMENATGIKVERIDFSDPQGGKGPCDRKAAVIKAHVRRYLNQGNDVVTPNDLHDAILSNDGVRGVRVTVVDGNKITTLNEVPKLDGISTFNNFVLSANGLTCWKSYNIGRGKTFSWLQLKAPNSLDVSLFDSSFSEGSFSDIVPKKKPTSLSEQEGDKQEADDCGDDIEESDNKLFACPIEGCIKSFQRYSALDNHIQYGKCQLEQEKHSLFDKAKILYHEKLLGGHSHQPTISQSAQSVRPAKQTTPPSTQGWALKVSKKSTRFTDKQKEFLDEMFNYGQETGHKEDPNNVAAEMRFAKDLSGNRRFEFGEFLSSTQINSYFSRKAAKLKKGTIATSDQDHQAAEEERNYHLTRNSVVEQCQLHHPIMYDSINLCNLFQTNTLNKLSLAVLKSISTFLELEVSKSYRRKAPYISLISHVLQTCSCSKDVG